MNPQEILKKKGITPESKHHNYDYLYKSVVSAMEEYKDIEVNKGDKIYIVECSSGSWSDNSHWIEGYFDKLEDAEKLKKEIEEEVEKNKHLPHPLFNIPKGLIEDYDYCSMRLFLESEESKIELTESIKTELMKWENTIADAFGFSQAIVKTIQKNKRL